MKYNNILIIFLLVFNSCEQHVSTPHTMRIKYYTSEDFSFHETIQITKNKNHNNNSIVFIYDYVDFHDGKDTLTIFKDSLYIGKLPAKYLSTKTLNYSGEQFKIKKYFYSGGHPHSFINYYVNNKKGILLSQIGGNVIVEYSFGPDSEKVLNQIMKDSTFFRLEF